MSKADVKNYFYSLLNVPELQKYFCLPPVPFWLAQSLGVVGVPATSDGWVWPMLLVVPMGWSWAFWIGQRVFQHQCLCALRAPPSILLQDMGPVPSVLDGNFAILPYCDNLNVLADDPQVANNVRSRVVDHMQSLGFLMHDVTEASVHWESLGRCGDGAAGVVSNSGDKIARMRKATEFLMHRPRITGSELEHMVGHIVDMMLLRP
eukprot:10120432-Karenia_brevis.AAC.1